jgi:hypothetical protein
VDALSEAHVGFAESVGKFSAEVSELLGMAIASLETHGVLIDNLTARVAVLEADDAIASRKAPRSWASSFETTPGGMDL